MDIVRLLSLVLCGFFFLGLFVVYELSLFDSELTTLMAQYARDEKTQTQVDTFVILQAKENTKQSKQAAKASNNKQKQAKASKASGSKQKQAKTSESKQSKQKQVKHELEIDQNDF